MYEEELMISEEQLDEYRVNGVRVQVRHQVDSDGVRDIKGIVVAWDDETVLIRKQNRKIVRVPRTAGFEPLA